MESKAHYALIGSFVLVALLAAVAFVAWLSNAQFDQQYDDYEVVFTGAVRGLSQGSEVRFNGLRVGEVTALRLDADDTNSVIADIQINSNTPVDSKSYARLEPLGLTGLNYIQIFAGGEQYPLLKDLPKGPYRIVGQGSQIDSFLDEGGSVIQGAQRALGRVNATLSPEAIEDFQSILANINTLTGNIKDAELNAESVEKVLQSIEQAANGVLGAAEAFDAAAKNFDGLMQTDVKSLFARLEQTLGEVDKTLGEVNELANSSTDLTVDASEAINRLSNSGLTDLEETADGIRRLILTLNDIAEKLDRSPVQFIAGEERQVMELPQ